MYYASWVAIFTSAYLLYATTVNVTMPAPESEEGEPKPAGARTGASRAHRGHKRDEGAERSSATAAGAAPTAPEPLAPEAEYADAAVAE